MFPDLIVFDGGIGHKQTGEKALAQLGLVIPCVAVVKDERHKARDIMGDPKIKANFERAIILANLEAHRFAITYHRKLRKNYFLSKS